MVELRLGDITLKQIDEKNIPFIAQKICEEDYTNSNEKNLKKMIVNLNAMNRLWKLNLRFFMVIYFRGEIVGAVDLKDYKCVEKKGELGYYIFEESGGFGISTSAIKLFLNYLFVNKDLNEIYLRVLKNATKRNLIIPNILGLNKKNFSNPFSNKYTYYLKKENFVKIYAEKEKNYILALEESIN